MVCASHPNLQAEGRGPPLVVFPVDFSALWLLNLVDSFRSEQQDMLAATPAEENDDLPEGGCTHLLNRISNGRQYSSRKASGSISQLKCVRTQLRSSVSLFAPLLQAILPNRATGATTVVNLGSGCDIPTPNRTALFY